MNRCPRCVGSRFGCGAQGCTWVPPGAPPGAWTHLSPSGVISCGWPVQPRTSGILDGLAVKAGDSAASRLVKELTMFAILTSPAWLALLILPKPQR